MVIEASWHVLVQLSPWLIIGTLLSGLLFLFLPEDLIRRKFHGFSGILNAVVLGIPLPLCSCGVIPAGIGLRKQGASNGSSVGFLISTPQTGVDSILVSSSFLGWPFALMKMAAAAVTGILGGLLVDRFANADEPDSQRPIDSKMPHQDRNFRGFVEHCLEILKSIWLWLVIGILVSAAIDVYVPKSWFAQVNEMGVWASMLVSLVIATPLYVCATASVPIAASLVVGGLSPAAAMVFLMAGPATNVTTIGAVRSQFGWKVTSLYLASIIGGSLVAGWLFASLVNVGGVVEQLHDHSHDSWWGIGSAVVLLGLMSWFAAESAIRKWRRWNRDTNDDSLTTLKIEGMTCEGCAGKIENGLRKLEGVEGVDVSLQDKAAFVNGCFDLTAVQDKIESLGFNVVKE